MLNCLDNKITQCVSDPWIGNKKNIDVLGERLYIQGDSLSLRDPLALAQERTSRRNRKSASGPLLK
jgi:hypothetical protein